MRNLVKTAALASGFVLLLACGGNAPEPGPNPTPGTRTGRGLAEQPDDKIAGAVGRLESEEDSPVVYATMADMLRGRLPGVEVNEGPNGNISVRIRGDQSIYYNKEPLLVVDGMPVPPYSFSSTLRTMDPKTVESVRVLKDAGSTSGYGSRGAHGVILIRLKRH